MLTMWCLCECLKAGQFVNVKKHAVVRVVELIY